MKDNMKKLREIAKREGFKLRSGKEFSFFFLGATIRVGKGYGPKVSTWRMLHELGHAELYRDRDWHHLITLYRIVKEIEPSDAFYRDYLKMEWKAWEQGMKIAKREGIKVDETGYWKHAVGCYNSYVEHLRANFE